MLHQFSLGPKLFITIATKTHLFSQPTPLLIPLIQSCLIEKLREGIIPLHLTNL